MRGRSWPEGALETADHDRKRPYVPQVMHKIAQALDAAGAEG